MSNAERFFDLVRSPIKLRAFLLSRLPSAYFAGVRIKSVSNSSAEVTVPYKWFTQNPFRSTYFACLSMAAEMSTGLLAMAHIYKRVPPISMLVVRVDSEYKKKATGKTTFICNAGNQIAQAIEEAIQTGEPRTIKVQSIGKNPEGEEVAEFFITWSFKAKKS